MKLFTACLVAAIGFAAPALAQLSGGAGGGVASPPTPQPRARVPDFAPPAVPGAGGPSLATSQPVARQNTGDPTVELFAAVNSGDYNAAQDAVSRGADMNAQNVLGETPLDLSIALNRNTITFMLLSARNESGGAGPVGAPWTLTPPPATAPAAAHHHARLRATPARALAPPGPAAVRPAGPGTPDPNAGFLGFGH